MANSPGGDNIPLGNTSGTRAAMMPVSGTLPATSDTEGLHMRGWGYNGLLGLLVLAGDIWALINIFQSGVSNEKKLLWALVVILLPVLGLILWFFLGPRDGRT